MTNIDALCSVSHWPVEQKLTIMVRGVKISDARLWSSANHDALCHLANHSILHLSMLGFVENNAFEVTFSLLFYNLFVDPTSSHFCFQINSPTASCNHVLDTH